MSKKVVKILSIDGGGIRGIIPAMILDAIEKRTDKKIFKAFDLIAGTSTGGILGLALTMPNSAGTAPQYTAQSLVRLYEQEGKHIFALPVWHRIRSLGGLSEEKYPSEEFEKLLETYFEGTCLKEALTDVLIPSYDMKCGQSRFFKSRKAKKYPSENFLMRDVARATSAAPTYFEPYENASFLTGHPLVDGGIFANHPAMCAFAEAKKLNPSAKILLVSLGTGELTRHLEYEDAKNWGMLRWIRPLFRIIFDGASDTVDYQLRQLLPDTESGKSYYRFQPKLSKGNDDMDDATETNLHALKSVAEEFIEKHNQVLDQLCEQLKSGGS